jgi:hypothetical protein
MSKTEIVHNPTSQGERRQILKDTAHTRAIAEQDLITGRYAAISRTTVIGSSPYPHLPPTSPWASDPVGPEPPINFQDMSAPEPVGTHQEIEQSLRETSGSEGPSPDPSNVLPDEEQRVGAVDAPAAAPDRAPSSPHSKD